MRHLISRAAALAVVLTIATSGAAMAASSTINETLTVLPTTTLTGVPATVDYGSGLTGTQRDSTATYILVASTNAVHGLAVSWSATDLTGAGTIVAGNNRSLQLTNAGGAPCVTVGALSGYSTAPGKPYGGPANTAQQFVISTGPGTCSIAGVKFYLQIPASATAGAYTGTTTISVAEQP